MRHLQHRYFQQFRCNMQKISAKRYRRAKLKDYLLIVSNQSQKDIFIDVLRSPGINCKSRVLYPASGFLSSAIWPSLLKKHYIGLIINQSIIMGSFFPSVLNDANKVLIAQHGLLSIAIDIVGISYTGFLD